ncbi:AfsR/SARP family transcriptional regulator [Actinomadura welshii]|uniref:AfsR/SARP family transcriptional regulator n=1 Tax=Actinomadura welshii TaxID=3103817 RepID=UPI0003AD56F2|nr:AfsR/SARP family transcriptional regulator [Actinomadura madurae]
MDVEFALLGPFEMRAGGRDVPMGGPKHRSLLAALLLRAGRPVPVEDLVEVIWGDEPPGNPRRVVQLYVTRLRQTLAPFVSGAVITTSVDGYRLRVAPGQTDVMRFQDRLSAAERAAAEDDLDAESEALGRALALWRGEPLAGVPSDRLQREVAPQLREQRMRTLERRFDVELRRGVHREIVGELFALTAQHPLREKLWAQLITALHASGRRNDALDAYHTVRRNLTDELGLDPGEDLQALHAFVLDGRPEATSSTMFPPVPRQLPPGVSGFTGRRRELSILDTLLEYRHQDASATRICVISGTAGIGKTALAGHWAHRVADRFPDGQLWMDLHGHDPERRLSPGQALSRFIRALGTPVEHIPLDVDEQVDLYRSLMDGRRTLVVLDDAESAAQVRPLLPGATGSLVVVTSREPLTGLIAAEGARPLVLAPLSPGEARSLLTARLGPGWAATEPAAVDKIIDLCARSPLALTVAAAHAALGGDACLDGVATALRAGRGPLDRGPHRTPRVTDAHRWRR